MTADDARDEAALEALLLGWDEDRLGPDELDELRALLGDAGRRARLVEHFQDTIAIEDALRATTAAAAASPPAPATGARRFVLAAIAACVAVAILARPAYQARHSARGVAVCVSAPPGATVHRDAGPAEPLRAGGAVCDRDTVTPGDGGAVSIRFATADHPEATTIEIAAGATVRLGDDDGAKRIAIDRGAVLCVVAKQAPGKAMVLTTPQARAEVVGTRFTLACDGSRTVLDVAEGTVRFTATNAEGVDVTGGHTASVGANGVPEARSSATSSAGEPAVNAAYQAGFVWHRAQDWRDGGQIGASRGNPGSDAVGGAVWSYASIHGGDGIDGRDPWYARPGRPLRWDDWYGAPQWVRDRDVGPVVDAAALMHVLAFPDDAPAVRWLNPTRRDVRLKVHGTLRVRWEKTVGDAKDPGAVDVVVARIAADGSVGGLLVAQRLVRSPASRAIALGSTAVRMDEQVLAIDLDDVRCGRSEQILVTARGSGGGWVWIGDDLAWTLAGP